MNIVAALVYGLLALAVAVVSVGVVYGASVTVALAAYGATVIGVSLALVGYSWVWYIRSKNRGDWE